MGLLGRTAHQASDWARANTRIFNLRNQMLSAVATGLGARTDPLSAITPGRFGGAFRPRASPTAVIGIVQAFGPQKTARSGGPLGVEQFPPRRTKSKTAIENPGTARNHHAVIIATFGAFSARQNLSD